MVMEISMCQRFNYKQLLRAPLPSLSILTIPLRRRLRPRDHQQRPWTDHIIVRECVEIGD